MDKEHFLKKLENKQPSALEQYSYDLLPETIRFDDKIPVKCHAHGVFYQKASSHLYGSGCWQCRNTKIGEGKLLTTEAFIRKSKSRFGEKFNYDKTEYVRKDVALTLTCPTHGDIVLTPDQHRWSKHGCPQCDFEISRAAKKDQVLNEARKIHGDKYDYSRVVFVNVNDKVEILCPYHGSFWQGLYDHTARETGCPTCSREADKLTLEDFVSKARMIHGDRYDYGKVEYRDGNSKVTITCKKHGDFTQRAASHLAGCKCKQCHIEENRLSAEEFIKNARIVHGDKYDYSKVVYHGNKKPVEIICPTHGSFRQRPNSHISVKAGCASCSESKGEMAVATCLKKFGIEHIREYRIKPHRYRYDFYLPKFNIYIEFHGAQHYRPVEVFGGEQAFLKVQERDEAKETLVAHNGGELIVLSYLNLIQDSVEQELIRRLKKIYRYWFVVEGKIRVFKTTLEVYKAFNVPTGTLVKDLVAKVEETVPDAKCLF